ncbi:D-alanyl-D-alanine carboxypeptidase/D-alanyl-D-alanine-endopeptidase [Sphingomonas naphthae]|uniref:D-alanyl-D-alanine carboxypeptidase/D-alanyl-D-alanine-endopeptidase n=1 Tax=Sphingomonas naphthae TaxID=1813468 RepID=A0ABY7TLW8_9SPHN|nr:D-alanyl-D-alanine carboxypeptidase/D-alanyl-D-alanine-endopeptidase [Sphingomonas naphthae]WCT74237.1 D-alanyl-D-alanine carboxypeptidase/D-alanyl-D-alanine-endopeptidase [Sphingomonas naphthae]
MQRSLPFLALLALAATPAQAQPPLQVKVEAVLAQAPLGTRFGLLVVDEAGRELVAINPDSRFVPASNTKMFTTAAAYATPGVLDATAGTAIRLDGEGRRVPDVVLVGAGDARLSSAKDCTVDCLATLADAVAARARLVGDVIGDDSLYPDERWSPGMSWNNIPTRSGTATSALTLDDNELVMTVTPTMPGKPPIVDLPAYYALDNRATTGPAGGGDLDFTREPNGALVRLTGTIAADAKPETIRLGIDDPARYAAWVLRAMLEARGVRVTGKVDVRHRPLTAADDPVARGGAPAARPPVPAPLATLPLPPLAEDVAITNKVSQNLHAELLLRRTGRMTGSGSIADGQAAVRAMLGQAGVGRTAYDFADGSGMSNYNRVAPRGAVGLLRWIAGQPWGAAWRASLPIGGVDGTLSRRFRGTPLEGKLFAKTGTLNATNALSGWLTTASGRTLTFSAFANDVPEDGGATKAIDAALLLIAAGT